jgi:hypothetical protein
MILYVNGDSHSAGHDAVIPGPNPNVAYGHHVANALKYEYVCDAVAGCSNDSIIDRTLKYLESNTPDFIIIGWSTWERETWYWNNVQYNVTSSGTDSVHPMLEDFYKKWVINTVEPYAQMSKERDAHLKIYLFHKLLKEKNIKHLFFNSYSWFFYTHQYNEPKFYWGHDNINYLHPYDLKMTYYEWLQNQGYVPINAQSFHYGADAHIAWANFILPKVQSILTINE